MMYEIYSSAVEAQNKSLMLDNFVRKRLERAAIKTLGNKRFTSMAVVERTTTPTQL